MFKLKSENNKLFILIVFFFVIEFFLVSDTPFFWDAVSKSVRAKWFYDNNYSQFVLPLELNSGHPPFWPLLLSLWWKVLGVSLFSSRILLLLINILVGYQILKLFGFLFPQKKNSLLVFLIFLEPTLLAQTTILNNDMLLLLFTLIAFNIVAFSNEKKQLLLTLALTGMLFSNLRGMLLFTCLLLIDGLFFRFRLKQIKVNFITYIISAFLFILFLLYQYNMLGWVIKTPSPNWASQRETADLYHIIKNIFSIVRNFIDYGRVAIIVLSSFLVYYYFRFFKFKSDLNIAKLIVSIGVFTIGLSFFFMFFTNPIGHRYYMISYILLVLICLVLLEKIYENFAVRKFRILILLAFISGHFYIYPSTISQGWDSSLAYFNYFKNRDGIMNFIEIENIDKSTIGTNLPLNRIEHSDLIKINKKFDLYSDLDVLKNEYIILSNIENSTSDENIITIKNDWILLKDLNSFGVYVSLYKKKHK